MDNREAQATVDTRHGSKIKTKTTHNTTQKTKKMINMDPPRY
jgi:hypothetical protein